MAMKKWLACLMLAFCLLLPGAAAAKPQIPPAPTSGSAYVQDYAGVISGDAEGRIHNLGAQLRAKTKAHVTVVTVKSLDGSPVEEYALTLLRQWGVGDKTLNNGVVILVAVADRQSRIEVGYGLEGAIPDAKAGRIQDEYMIPYFQKGDYEQGILSGYQAVAAEVAKEYNVELRTDAKPVRPVKQQASDSLWDGLPWWGQLLLAVGALGLLIFDWMFLGGRLTFLILSLLRSRGGGGGGGGGFGGGSGGGGGSSRKW